MKTVIIILAMLLLTGFTSTDNATDVKTYVSGFENVLGTSLDMKINAGSAAIADKAEESALNEIDRLDSLLSSYKSNSEFSRWQRTLGENVRVSPELFEVLRLFDDWKYRTGGALNPSAGIAVALWKKAEATQRLPDASELEHTRKLMNQPHWALDSTTQTAKHLTLEPLLLNSFVKSYIIEKTVRRIMTIPGITGCVVNIGGDIVISGDLQEQVWITDPQNNSVNDTPLSMLTLGNNAIATSGNYRRGYNINNKWYSHILDVRTALPVDDIISATVIAPDARTAGALATAFNILSIEESKALAKQFPGVLYQVVTKSGERIESKGWSELEVKSFHLPEKFSVGNGTLEMSIEFELASFSGRFRRPFVAVWVENSKKESVRTLALWYNKPRWLPDLKRWFAKNQDELSSSAGTIASISSATRSPGVYKLRWDGMDGQGNKLPPGKYFVYIEAAREHGTYQLISQQIDWDGQSKQMKLKGGVEIASASLNIYPVAAKK